MTQWKNFIKSLPSKLGGGFSKGNYINSKIPSVLAFDGGVGSLPISQGLAKAGLQVTQLGHLKKFPFGKMSNEQLKNMVCDVAVFANESGFDALVIASNTPTIMVGREVKHALKKAGIDIPIFGVEPPIKKAFQTLEEQGKPLKLCVLGTNSMVNSKQMRQYADKNTPEGGTTILEDASYLIENHIEGNSLPTDKENAVYSLIKSLKEKHGDIPAFTLSSTHLPFLKKYFEKVSPKSLFLDPAEDVIKDISCSLGIKDSSKTNNLQIRAVYTEPETDNPSNAVSDYNARLNNLAGYKISIAPVIIKDKSFDK